MASPSPPDELMRVWRAIEPALAEPDPQRRHAAVWRALVQAFERPPAGSPPATEDAERERCIALYRALHAQDLAAGRGGISKAQAAKRISAQTGIPEHTVRYKYLRSTSL